MMTTALPQAAEIVFWGSLLLILYVYAGYPLTLLALRRRTHDRARETVVPRVTVVIAAHNEAAHIAGTVRNKLAQDYPAERLDVIVVSDGSVDGTDEAVAAIADPRLTLLRQEPRQGKTAALNRAVAAARGDIIVFSDANSHYEPAAIRHLAEAFAEPTVGYVTGRLVYEDPGGTVTGGGSGLYMRYENWLRELETGVGSIVGVNGGIDAVRRNLYVPMRPEDLPDFVLPLRVVARGFRTIYRAQAVAHEQALGQQQDEFRMRVRVSLRALHALVTCREVLHPRLGLFAFQVLVHKILRYLLLVPLATTFVSSAILAPLSSMYATVLGAQLVAYALAGAVWLSGGQVRLRPARVAFYFSLVNIAAGAALIDFLRGHKQIMWTPRKGA